MSKTISTSVRTEELSQSLSFLWLLGVCVSLCECVLFSSLPPHPPRPFVTRCLYTCVPLALSPTRLRVSFSLTLVCSSLCLFPLALVKRSSLTRGGKISVQNVRSCSYRRKALNSRVPLLRRVQSRCSNR